ncbi:putative membrane protein [Halalkaliarchaeum sp. AArc-CO]|uniref:hypothetical protein n=1 Tax=unclassified Halalkaliarchaeum TaxID=2678344 RepID=UPI00217CC492|nr:MULTISPECIES: hypothetical protein [unclassified Halalkaliarchaeum]MDR5673763.1 hypothetical protein [Halalkaliarchaeum sp. AArc-GB]UWG52136.1 putative membrane protein [Halalkaliarchaeum sp. AArc-CO]
MQLRNREGTPIDPVPFLVAALLAATIAIAWGPVYLLEFGVDLAVAVAVSVAVAAVSVAVAYYRLVWTANPTIREEVPADVRFRKFLYAILVAVIVLFVLQGIQVSR